MNTMQYLERDLNPPDDQGFEPDESDLKQAREELAERIAGGEKVGKLDLEACLECELNADERVFLADMATLLGSLYRADDSSAAFWLRASEYIERLAAKHLSDEDVREYAISKQLEESC